MGKCITIIKLVGTGSVGIASSYLLYNSIDIIKNLIPNINIIQENDKTKNSITSKIIKLINSNRLLFTSFSLISLRLFSLAYTHSNKSGKHPYLIYASITIPLSIISYYLNCFKFEQNLLKIYNPNSFTVKSNNNLCSFIKNSRKSTLKFSINKINYLQELNNDKYDSIKKILNSINNFLNNRLNNIESIQEGEESTTTTATATATATTTTTSEETSPLDNSIYNSVKKPEFTGDESLEEELPKSIAVKDEDEIEINNALILSETKTNLRKLSNGYKITAGISSLSFIISVIGLLGDNY
ncbi:hydrolase activity protein [[Candida] boidinii]|nr:hydrolase activity protein [[Candida] boidinii]